MKINFNEIKFETSVGNIKQLKKSLEPEFVFSGRSNVGKSSLINKIFNRKHLARVSSSPGKTATINFYKTSGVYFIDLPGYGFSRVSKKIKDQWRKLINSYFISNRNIKMVFQLVDIRHDLSQQDCEMIAFLMDYKIPFSIVLTKTDKISNNQKNYMIEKIKNDIINNNEIILVPFSSVTREGVDKIKNIIDSCV